MNLENWFYIPVNTVNIPNYFSAGIIMPSGFYSKQTESVQNILGSKILLSKERWIKGANCSIEVILTDLELSNLQIFGGKFYGFPGGIPISRIKNLFFQTERQLETTLWNANNGAAFIPRHLAKVDGSFNPSSLVALGSIPVDSDQLDVSDLIENAKRFDVLLGGFAFMRIASPSNISYPDNYLDVFTYFNQSIKELFPNVNSRINREYSDNFLGLFKSNHKDKWSSLTNYIYRNLSTEDVGEYALKNNLKFEKNVGLITLQSIDRESFLFDLALLSIYGNYKSKSLEDLLSFLSREHFSPSKIAEIGLLFGLNIGYVGLRNRYEINGKNIDVKFNLQDKLHYYIIESLYQFVFNKNRNKSEFGFLEKVFSNPEIADKKLKEDSSFALPTANLNENKTTVKNDDVQASIFEIFLNRLTADFASFVPPFIPKDSNSIRIYVQDRYVPLLKDLVQSKNTIKGTNTSGSFSGTFLGQRGDENGPKYQPEGKFDNLGSLPLTELKKIAKKHGIDNCQRYQSTFDDISELIRLIRNVPRII